MFEIISTAIEYLVNLIGSFGNLGIFIGMVIESSFFPFPSEVILPPAGVLIARGELSFSYVLISAVLGSLVGAFINYYIALFLGRTSINKLIIKYGKVFFLKESTLEKSEKYFKKNGEIATFTGRLIPGVRQLISLPAGFFKMNKSKFAVFTALGAGLWSIILIYLGYLYGENSNAIHESLGRVTIAILLLIIILIISYLLVKRSKQKPS